MVIFLLCCGTFSSSFSSKLNSELSVVTFNIANYDDHKHWDTRIDLIVRDLIAANADLIALQEVRMNPDQSSTKRTYQNQAEQILHKLNKEGKYLGAQLVTQPTMFYPSYVTQYEESFNSVIQLHANKSLPKPWKEDVSSFIEMGDYESVRHYIRKAYGDGGMMQGEYVLPSQLNKDKGGKTMFWEGSAIISKRRIMETGSIFMVTPDDCTDVNQRATQYISVNLDSSDSKLSPSGQRKKASRFHLFNTHLGLETPCAMSEVHETTEYMNRFSGPSLLVGDFNIEPQHPALNRLRESNFHDLWQHFHPEHNDTKENGSQQLVELEGEYQEDMAVHKCPFNGWCTFPSDNPIKRIDYAWANDELKSSASSMSILGTKPTDEKHPIFPSDHLGYVVKFKFNPEPRNKTFVSKKSKKHLSPL